MLASPRPMIATWTKRCRALMSLGGRALALWGALMLASCKQDAAEARFADDYHCQATSTEELSDGSYHVSGCGIEATYTWVREAGGWGNQSSANIVCIREAEESPRSVAV